MASTLSDHELTAFKQRLKQRAGELLADIRQALLASQQQHYIDLAGQVHDLEEQSVADLLVDVDLAHQDRHIQEIRDIEAALIRIATRTYGVCIDCDGPITLERLQVYPTAKRCQQCQTHYEKTYSQPPAPHSL
jgi:RNA polymerase-binding protein DksA